MNTFENIYKSNEAEDKPTEDTTEDASTENVPAGIVKTDPDETDTPEIDPDENINAEMGIVETDTPETTHAETNTPAETTINDIPAEDILEETDSVEIDPDKTNLSETGTPETTSDLNEYIEDINAQEQLTDTNSKEQYFNNYLQRKLALINGYSIISSKLTQNPAVNITPFIHNNTLINESLYIPIVKHKISSMDSYKMRKYDKYGVVLNQSGQIENFGIFCTNRTEFNDERFLLPSAITIAQTSLRPTTGIAKMYNADRRTFMYNILESKDENSEIFTDMFSYYNIFNSFNNNSSAFTEYYKNISDPHNLELYNEFIQNSFFSYADFKNNYKFTSYTKPQVNSEEILNTIDFYKNNIKGDPESILVQKYPIPELTGQQKRFVRMFQEHPAKLKYFMKLHTDGYFYVKTTDVLDNAGIIYPYTVLMKRAVDIQNKLISEHPDTRNLTDSMLEASDFDKSECMKICCKHIFMLYTNIPYDIIVAECEQDNICKICTEELPDITDYNPHVDIFNSIIVKYLNCLNGVYNGIVVVASLSEIINGLCKYIIGENSSEEFDFKEIRIAVGALALRYVIKKTTGKIPYNNKLKKTILELEQLWNDMAVKNGNLPQIDKILSMESEFDSIKESTNRLALTISKRNYDFAHSIDKYNSYPLTVMFNQEVKLLDDISGYKNYIKDNAGNKEVLEIFTEGYDYMDAYNFGLYRLWLNGYMFKGIVDEWNVSEVSVKENDNTNGKVQKESKIIKVKHKAEQFLKCSSKLFQLGVKPKDNKVSEIYEKYRAEICPCGTKHMFDMKNVCMVCKYNKSTGKYAENIPIENTPEIMYDTDFYMNIIETKNKIITDEFYQHYNTVRKDIRTDNLKRNIEGKINFNTNKVPEFIQAVDESSVEIIKDIQSVLKIDLTTDIKYSLKEIVSYLFSGVCKPKFSEYGIMLYSLWCYRKGYSVNLLY